MQKLLALLIFITIPLLPRLAAAQDEMQELDLEISKRWETSETPALLSARNFPSENRFELALQIAYLPNDDYYNYFPVQLNLAYHFNADWALEFQSSILLLKSKTELNNFLRAKTQNPVDISRISDKQQARFNLVAIYHPLYGKWSFNRSQLGHFDWGVYAGLGLVIAESRSLEKLKSIPHFNAVLGTQFHFFITPYLAIRADFALNIYPAFNRVAAPCTIGIGISYYTPPII